MSAEAKLYYAVGFTADGKSEFVRFARPSNRKFWIAKDVANRRAVPPSYKPLVDLMAKGATWEYIDGVSYANPGGVK